MKIKSKRELLVKSFVQSVSSPTSFSKRYKKVCKLLDSRVQLTEEQWFRIWRGLYYSIWYTEMGKGCEELITKIGTSDDLLMILTGFKSLTNDWFGIDAFRVDKFMFLVRIMINNCLRLQLDALHRKTSDFGNDSLIGKSLDDSRDQLSNDNAVEDEQQDDNELVRGKDVDNDDKNGLDSNKNERKSAKHKNKKFNKKFDKRKETLKPEIQFPVEVRGQLIDSILTIVKSSIGLTLHINDIFIDELIKAMNELKPNWSVSEKIETYFDTLLPFVKLMALIEDDRLRSSIKENIFDKLKNEIIISESVGTRKQVLEKFIQAMIAIGSVPEVSKKSRHAIYNIVELYKSKLTQLNTSNQTKGIKRKKIVVKSGKQKKVKYELTTSTPFVRSIVPIAVV